MAITVYSPYNGQPVEVRDQDVGRAVKDGDGRTFYVLAKSDGTGYYGAITRMGGQKDEDRANELEYKATRLQGRVDDEFDAVADAPRRSGSHRGTIVVLVFFAAIGGLIWAVGSGKNFWQKGPPANPIVLEGAKPNKTITTETGSPAGPSAGSTGGKGQFDPYAPLPAIPDGNVAVASKPIDSAPVTPGHDALMNHGAPVKGPATPDGNAALGKGKPLKSAPTTAPSTETKPAGKPAKK